jgi:tetratricopeptide (TPR) repeat protein
MGVGYGPAWSPRGDAVAYVAERYLSEGFAEIWLWDARARRVRQLARTLAGACLAPAWSPRGDAVAFVRLPFGAGPDGPGSGGRPADIVVVDTDDGEARPLVADGLANLMPAWSPDGKTVAFHTCGEPGREPHVVRRADLAGRRAALLLDTPFERFLLEAARRARGQVATLAPAVAALPQEGDPVERAYAHRLAAEDAATRDQWPAAARHARDAAASPHPPSRRRALALLAQAQMRQGKPKAAAATAERLATEFGDAAARRLAERLRRGLDAAAEAEAALRDAPAPEPIERLAQARLGQLGDPRGALELYFRLLSDFPDFPGGPRAARGVLDCCRQLGPAAASHRVLERAAARLGERHLTPDQILLLAETAAANGLADAALAWLDRLPLDERSARVAERAAAACAAAGDLLQARGRSDAALEAFQRGARGASGAPAARSALRAAQLLVEAGRPVEAVPLLLRALSPEAGPDTVRDALRYLAAGHLRRADPVANDAARVGELVTFGFHGSAVAFGEPLVTGLPSAHPCRGLVDGHLATAFERVAAYHLARGELAEAKALVARWARAASPGGQARALLWLARCQELAGEAEARVATLSRIVLEFPDSGEAAEARRELHKLSAPRGPR